MNNFSNIVEFSTLSYIFIPFVIPFELMFIFVINLSIYFWPKYISISLSQVMEHHCKFITGDFGENCRVFGMLVS